MDSTIFAKPQNDRRSFIGGSDARVIMGADETALVRLWREKRGETEPEDLSDNLIVQLGIVTEDLNRRWYERNTGQTIKHIQRRMQHPVHKWMAATLDGLVDPGGAVFEAKFMLPWTFSEEPLPKSIWRSFNTICGSPTHAPRCFPSSPVAANGSR
jgi:predicted phage-related endonuclease